MAIPAKCRFCQERCTDNIAFLMDLTEEKQQKIMKSAVRKQYKKDSYLFMAEDPVDAIYIVHSGKVKLSVCDRDGREQIIGLFSERDTIWEGIFTEESRHPYGAVCVTDVDCCKLYRRDVESIMRDSAVALRVIGLLSQKLYDANERILLLATSSPKARLAGFLLQRSRQLGQNMVVLRLEEIAASIHLRPETVSRKIKEMEKEGLIAKSGQSGIQILDREGLRRLFQE